VTAAVPRPRRTLAILTLALILSMTTWFSATAILPELTAAWHLDGGARTWMTNGVQLGFVIGALGLSLVNLPDIAPLRLLMAAAATLAACANLLLLFVEAPGWAVLLRVVTGLALAGVYPPALKLVATWFQRGRGLAMGFVIAGLTLGSAFPHFIRAVLGTFDWHAVVVAASLLTLAGAALFLAFAREGPYPFNRGVFDPRQLGRVVRNRGVALANLGYFGHMWELYAMWGWFLAFASATVAAKPLWPAAAISGLAFAVVAIGVLGAIGGGLLSDRIGRTATTALMMAISAACAALIGFAVEGPFLVFLAIALIWGASVIADSAQFSAMTTEVGEPDLVGTALAFQLGIGFALTMVSLWLVPVVAAAVGWRFTFLVLVPGPVIGIIAMLVLRRLPEAERIAQGRR
jgi:MFS family permease